MSILAQARLTLLASLRRNDVLDGCAYIHASRYRSAAPKLVAANQMVEVVSLKAAPSPSAACRLGEDNRQHGDNTPNCQRRRNRTLDRLLVRKLFNEEPNNNANINLWLIDKQNTPHLVSNIFKQQQQQPETLSTLNYDSESHLEETKKNNCYHFLSLNKRINLYTAFGWQSNGHHKQQTTTAYKSTREVSKPNSDNHYYSSSQQHHGYMLVSMIGVLGLFGRTNNSDIEEERAKLTDEERIKKMTPAELNIAKGVLAMCDQAYSKADEFFHKALQLSQEAEDEEQETLVLNLLASNYFESGDLESAEKLFIDLIKRMIAKDVDPHDLAILELSLKLASIYSRNHTTHNKAMKGFKFVINSLLVKLQDLLNSNGELEIVDINDDRKDELALLGWSYDWFAKHLIEENDFDGATMLLNRAITISSRILGPLHDQTLILLNDVGTTLAMNNSPEEGKEYLQKAVEGAIETKSKELASFYVNLGLVNLKLRRLTEAKRYCEYSIELALQNRDHNNSDEVIKLSRSCLNEVERLNEANK